MMWAFLTELGLWALLAGFVVIVILATLLWFGPFLILRWAADRLTGRVGVVDKALAVATEERLEKLREYSRAQLMEHPNRGAEEETKVAGRWVIFSWQVDPTPAWETGTTTVVLWHELFVFNLPFSPKIHGVRGFKITASGGVIDLTPEELVAYN
jgi:hypothetical protein